MGRVEQTALALCGLAQTAENVRLFRVAALGQVATLIRFDRALFHELSPRVSLDRAALFELDRATLEAGTKQWDDNAVLFGRLRELALAQRGVASDADAFPAGSRVRRSWQERVAKPLGVSAVLAAHLVVQERVISALLLFRRSGTFSARDEEVLRQLLPALAVSDALQQALLASPVVGPPTTLRCVDQRLTARQREIVERVALGHTNAQIGAALGLSANTVRNLLAEVRRRLSAANRAELVRLAVLR